MNFLKRRVRRARRTSMISIRLEPGQHNFLKEKNLSPTRILDEAINKLRRKKKW
jgi:hypothetical protein